MAYSSNRIFYIPTKPLVMIVKPQLESVSRKILLLNLPAKVKAQVVCETQKIKPVQKVSLL